MNKNETVIYSFVDIGLFLIIFYQFTDTATLIYF